MSAAERLDHEPPAAEPLRKPVGLRVPPPMRVVKKGWWTLHEERVPADELEREDRLARSASD
jgi:hypothetical protein